MYQPIKGWYSIHPLTLRTDYAPDNSIRNKIREASNAHERHA